MHNLLSVDPLSPVWSSCPSVSLSLSVCQPVSAILRRQQQLLEPWRAGRGGRWRVNKKTKQNVANYLQSSGAYPISGRADEWGEESHMTNVVDTELVHEWETEREGERARALCEEGGREGTSMRVVYDERAITLQGKRLVGKKVGQVQNLINLASYI